MDMRPPARPGTNIAPQAPLVEPKSPVPEDPFKPDPQPPMPPTGAKPPKKKSHKVVKVLLMLLLMVAIAGAVGYGVYYWQHQHISRLISQRGDLNNQISDLQGQVSNLESKNDTLTKAAAATTPTTDEQVITAVTDYCQAQVDPTKGVLVYTQQTSGPAKKTVLYSSDKRYATVTAVCAPTGNTTTPSKVYYVKNSGKSWVVLYAASSPDATQTKLYAIPNDFN